MSQTILLKLEEPGPRKGQPLALWQLGFRPFYLLASVFAALSVLIWVAQVAGWLPVAVLPGVVGHAHEMVFGYALAVVVGFLFTAGRNWSGQATPSGAALMALAGLWLVARVLALTPWIAAAAVANVAFAWLSAAGLARALVRGGSQRNYFFVGLLVVMGLGSLAVHLSAMGMLALPAWAGLQLGLDVVLFIMVVMGGRVIPMFTNNGVPGTLATRKAWLEKLSLGAVLAILAADLVGLNGPLMAVLLLVAAGAHGGRLAWWQPWRTLRTPLVWILHLAYAWIVLHLALRGAAQLGWVSASVAAHALTAGAVGGLTLGMMTRTARGHTARPLRADRHDVAIYWLVTLAALVRVGVPLLWPSGYVDGLVVSALMWLAAFLVYAVHYGPWLLQPRLDGKPG